MASSSVHTMELLLFFTLLQLALIVLAARAGGALATRWGQSAVVGEIAVGVLLGPSLFGALAPHAFETVFRSTPAEPLTILSQVGLLLLMFQIGLAFDFSHLAQRVHRRTVWAVAVAGLVVPFAIGAAFGALVPREIAGTDNRLGFVLFVATAFSITALPVMGRILVDFKLTRSPVGVIAISCAAINDVIGWLMLALVSALSVSAFSAGPFALRVLGIVLVGALAWWVLRPLLSRFVRRQLGACCAAARWVGLDSVRARIIGMLMNTRGLMELIVINVGLEMGMIGRQVFTMLVLMALFSTVITSPALRRWLPRLHPRGEAAPTAALGGRG